MNSNVKWFNYLTSERRLSVDVLKEAQLKIINDRLQIPIFDSRGTLLFSKYRKAPWDESGTPKYFYEKGSTAAVYGYHFQESKGRWFIVEGELDVLAIRTIGENAITSTGGAKTWRPDWPLPTNPTLLLDNDVAGIAGAVKIALMIPGRFTFSWVPSGYGKDVSDLLRAVGKEQAAAVLNDPYRQIVVDRPEIETKKEWRAYARELVRQAMQRENSPGRKFLAELALEIKKRSEKTNHTTRKMVKGELAGNWSVERARGFPISKLLDVRQNKICCLWHNEKTPSLHYYPKNNSLYCFGSCGRAFDSIDVYMKLHDCDFLTAVKQLSQ